MKTARRYGDFSMLIRYMSGRGSYNNPELYVKIWFDPSGRIDVNYFHVSYDDILIRTAVGYNTDWIGDVKGVATRSQRFVQHRLMQMVRVIMKVNVNRLNLA
ncbi:MAG: hypothetical protein R3E08_05370 [Thiotrichaceae bacterium]